VTDVRVDRDVRHEIRSSLDATLFVEAGAGTGKTAELVSRVVSLVANGVPLHSIAAITFTEAAASELRDRIRVALEKAARGDVELPLHPSQQARCHVALGELDDAALSTLHGFAQRILVEHPLEAGLPPTFDVLDQVEAGVGFEQRWGDFLDHLFADPVLEGPLLRALGLGLRLRDLHAIARAMHEHADRLPGSSIDEPPAPPLEVAPVVGPLDAALALGSCCIDDADTLAVHLHDLSRYRDELATAVDELDALDVLTGATRLDRSRIGNQQNWGGRVGEVRDLLAQAERARQDLVERIGRAALGALVARLRSFVLEYAHERRRDGRLEFHDLLVLARDVLRRVPSVRAALAHRFAVLLVDEFQDTDPLQIEIAVLLTTDDPDAGSKPWYEVAIAPGRLFLVGDPKQSIY
jgi:ATP-dependent exoDNAse (exonuclease V) beta subunit